MKTLYEVSHYYAVKGPTAYSETGWQVMTDAMPQSAEHQTMLFIDDVHGPECVPPPEAALPALPALNHDFDFVVTESQVKPQAWEALKLLKALPGKKKARGHGGHYFFKEFALTTPAGQPACVLYDAGLTLYKARLGFEQAINVLPRHYEAEQRQLLRTVRHLLPGFCLRVILFDLGGSWRELHLD